MHKRIQAVLSLYVRWDTLLGLAIAIVFVWGVSFFVNQHVYPHMYGHVEQQGMVNLISLLTRAEGPVWAELNSSELPNGLTDPDGKRVVHVVWIRDGQKTEGTSWSDLSTNSKHKGIVHLDLTEGIFENEIGELPDLPGLESIYLPPGLLSDPQELKRLAKYPQLKKLAFSPWEGREVNPEEAEQYAEILESFPALETVYVGQCNKLMKENRSKEQFASELAAMELLKLHCSTCMVLPSVSWNIEGLTYLYRNLFFSILLTVSMFSVLKYLSSSTGQLTPRLVFPHLLVLGLLSLMLICVMTWLNYREPYQFSAILCGVVLFLVPLTIGVWLMPHLVYHWFGPALLIGVMIFWSFPMGTVSRKVSVFYLGGYPQLEIYFWWAIVVSALSFPFALRRALLLLSESGYGDLLLSNPKQVKLFKSQTVSQKEDPSKKSRADQRLLTTVGQYLQNRDSEHRIELWRSGNRFRGTSKFLWLALILIGVDMVLWVGGIGAISEPWDRNAELIITMMLSEFMIFFFIFGPVWAWGTRSVSFPTEILLPVPRSQLKKELIRAILRDSLPLLKGCLPLVAWAGIRAESSGFFFSLSNIVISLFLMTTVWIVGTVLVLAALVFWDSIKRHGMRFVLIMATCIALVFVLVTVLSPAGLQEMCLIIGMSALVLTAILFRFIWNYMDRKEWGLV